MKIKRLLAALAVFLAWLAAGAAATPTGTWGRVHGAPPRFEVEATLSPPAPAPISVGNPISATVDFEQSFALIYEVCFLFAFQGDLLDPGDFLSFASPQGLAGAGMENLASTPQTRRDLCFPYAIAPDAVSLFLDGQQDFDLQMEKGSVIVGSLRVSIALFSHQVNLPLVFE